jgi:hypothetical protein
MEIFGAEVFLTHIDDTTHKSNWDEDPFLGDVDWDN